MHTTVEEAVDAVGELARHPPRTVLVVSDLHLASGRDPATGRFDRTENFFADDAFARWLAHHHAEARDGGLLVFNGDTFDFLRVVATPRSAVELAAWERRLASLGVVMTPADLAASIDDTERRYGLGTEDFKSAWKLWEMAGGHREFFAALRGWVDAGGRILVVKGNHDVELHWPLVRAALRQQVAGDGAAAQVAVCDDFIRIANLHLEHGHRYEEVTRLEGSPTLTVPGKTGPVQVLRLPLGSFVNRYLVNHFEDIYPFLDNARPLSRSLRLIFQRHPIKSAGMIRSAVRLVAKSLKMSDVSTGRVIGLLLNPLLPYLAVLALAALVYFGPLAGPARRLLGELRPFFPLLGLLMPYVQGALRDLFSRRRLQFAETHFSDEAYRALAARKPAPVDTVLYAVYGHTHDQDVQLIRGSATMPDVMYLNPGTWTALFIEDRPDLQGRAFRPYLHFTLQPGGEYAHRFFQWNDDRGVPEPVELLGPVLLSGRDGTAVKGEAAPAQPAEGTDAEPAADP